MLATVAVGGGSRQRRVGEVHLGGTRDSVNGFLQFCFAIVKKAQNSAVFWSNFFGVGEEPNPAFCPEPNGIGIRGPDSPSICRWIGIGSVTESRESASEIRPVLAFWDSDPNSPPILATMIRFTTDALLALVTIRLYRRFL